MLKIQNMLIPFSSMPDSARLWVYSGKSFFENGDEEAIYNDVIAFLEQWTAHSRELKAASKIDLKRHLLIAVDESTAGASGCSIDSCVHYLQDLGRKYNTDLFDRLNYTFLGEDKRPFMVHHHSLSEAYSSGIIKKDTLFVNSLVKSVGEYRNQFLQPLSRSFQARFIDQLQES